MTVVAVGVSVIPYPCRIFTYFVIINLLYLIEFTCLGTLVLADTASCTSLLRGAAPLFSTLIEDKSNLSRCHRLLIYHFSSFYIIGILIYYWMFGKKNGNRRYNV